LRVCGSYEKTVRIVANGILAIALIQSILTGLAFMLAGVLLANLWALLCFASFYLSLR
jgi:predicted PurR-regulated permease PerM